VCELKRQSSGYYRAKQYTACIENAWTGCRIIPHLKRRKKRFLLLYVHCLDRVLDNSPLQKKEKKFLLLYIRCLDRVQDNSPLQKKEKTFLLLYVRCLDRVQDNSPLQKEEKKLQACKQDQDVPS
jgi:hypothetical protein